MQTQKAFQSDNNSGFAGDKETAVKSGGVATELDKLSERITILQQWVAELEGHLDVVLTPEPQTGEGGIKDQPATDSLLAGRISTLTYQVEKAISAISKIRDRIDL